MKGWVWWLLFAPLAMSISACGVRAEPEGVFRLKSNPMTSEPARCSALPNGVRLASSPYELEDYFYLAEGGTKRRFVQLQLLHGDLAEAKARMDQHLRAAGFRKDSRTAGTFRRAGYGSLTIAFEAVEAHGAASPVVANISLDLPASSFTDAQAKRCRAPKAATTERGGQS